jgi:hypothetical protein
VKVHTYYDDQAMAVMIGLPQLHPSEQLPYVEYAKERIAAFHGGAHRFPALTYRFRSELNDEFLLVRHDLEYDCISIDRYIPQFGCYFKLANLLDEQGRGRRLQFAEEQWLIDMLRAGDMRKTTPKELLAKKHEASAKQRDVNKKRGEEEVKAAVDSLSSKSIKQFVDVHRAIHTGERIVSHGADVKSLEVMAEAGKTAPMVPTGKALNPGMHPLTYARDSR